MTKFQFLFFGIITLVITSCSIKIPDYITPIENFNTKLYSGKWYEIARFDFKYEKDMNQVTAEYSLNKNGTIKVLNKGYDYKAKKWKQVIGRAKFNGETNKSTLKVSFFGPFYAGYNVVMMEPDYETALVFGENKDYIWFLSRKPTMSEATKQKFLAKAKSAGYDLNRLVWTEQNIE